MTSDIPASAAAPEQPAGARPAGKRGPRVPAKLILVVLIAGAVLWFALVNTRHAKITMWVESVQAPVWLVLLCTFAAGVIVGFLLRRRRRPRR